jgi:hypothetical protein
MGSSRAERVRPGKLDAGRPGSWSWRGLALRSPTGRSTEGLGRSGGVPPGFGPERRSLRRRDHAPARNGGYVAGGGDEAEHGSYAKDAARRLGLPARC